MYVFIPILRYCRTCSHISRVASPFHVHFDLYQNLGHRFISAIFLCGWPWKLDDGLLAAGHTLDITIHIFCLLNTLCIKMFEYIVMCKYNPFPFHRNHPAQNFVDVRDSNTQWIQTMGVFGFRAMGFHAFQNHPNMFWPLLAIQNPFKTMWRFSSNESKNGALKADTRDGQTSIPQVPEHGDTLW